MSFIRVTVLIMIYLCVVDCYFTASPKLCMIRLYSSNDNVAAPYRAPYTRVNRPKRESTKDLLSTAPGTSTTAATAPASQPNSNRSKTSGSSGGKRIMPQGEKREKEISNPNRLRIIAGTAKGKKIESPDVYLRPMMSKVREALFSTLTHMGIFQTSTTRVLDIFSGSGSVGLESLSRGAVAATFVDMSPVCIEASLNNAVSCGFDAAIVNGVCARAEDVLQHPTKHGLTKPFQLITMTPPYEEVVYDDLLNALCSSSLVEEDTIVVIEYPVEMGSLPYVINDKLFGLRNRRYGRTVIAMYVYRPSRSYEMKAEEFILKSYK